MQKIVSCLTITVVGMLSLMMGFLSIPSRAQSATSTATPLAKRPTATPTATVQPTRTLTAVPKDGAGGGIKSKSLVATISLTAADAVTLAPSDIQTEIFFNSEGGGGAPGEFKPDTSQDGGDQRFTGASGEGFGPSLAPYIAPAGPPQVTFGQYITIDSEGWADREVVTVAVTYSDGRSLTDTNKTFAEPNGVVHYYFTPNANATLGPATVAFSGKSKTVRKEALIINPQEAGILLINADGFAEFSLNPISFHVYGFEPNELVDLIDYKYLFGTTDDSGFRFDRSFRLQMGPEGRAIVKMPEALLSCTDNESMHNFVLVGEKTGVISAGSLCALGRPNTLVTQSEGTRYQFVAADTGEQRLVIRTDPNPRSKEVTRVKSYTLMRVLNHGVTEGLFWWQVALANKQAGWVRDHFVRRYASAPINFCTDTNFGSLTERNVFLPKCRASDLNFDQPAAINAAWTWGGLWPSLSLPMDFQVRTKWYLDNKLILTKTSGTDKNPVAFLKSSTPKQLLPPGKYRVELYVDDFLAQSAEFTVR